MKKIIILISLLSTPAVAQQSQSLVEKSANEWQVEVDQAAQRGAVAPYFLFRDLEIRSENSLLKTEAELKTAETEYALAKEITERKSEIFKKRALSAEEFEMAELWVLKTGKELDKAKLKLEREKIMIEIFRFNRQEAFSGENIAAKLPALYLKVWESECIDQQFSEEIALAERNYAKRVKERREQLYLGKTVQAVTGFEMLESIASLKKAEEKLNGVRSTVRHCRALDLLPHEM